MEQYCEEIMGEDEKEKTIDVEKSQAYNPEDGIVFEWWGRAEGIMDEQ